MFPISDSDVPRRSFPFVNITLIVICAAVFIYELFIGSLNRAVFFYRLGFIPAELVTGINYEFLFTTAGRLDITSPIPNWATAITSMFIHGGWLHIITNMLFLWVFGNNIEDRFGHLKYFIFYLIAGIVAVWLHSAINKSSEVPLIGASGAIAGVLGAYLVLFPTSRIRTIIFAFFIIGSYRIPAILLLITWFILQFVSGIGSLDSSIQSGGTAYWAHIGGFIFGIIMGIVYRIISWGMSRSNRSKERPIFYETTESDPPKYWRGRRV